MNMKPTVAAVEAARAAGTSDMLNKFAGERAHIASNPSAFGRNAGKTLAKKAREACKIPAGVALFELA